VRVLELLQRIEDGFADLDERWSDSHRTPVAERSLDNLPAIALNTSSRVRNIGLDRGANERLAANLCNMLLRVPNCMRPGSLVI
jgi:hypothetical protein